MRLPVIGLLALTLIASPATAAPAPLFASDQPLQVTISGPISSIARNAHDSVAAHRGMLQVGGEMTPITLAARGLSRRNPELCSFPPLKIVFQQPPSDGSAFAGQDKLKLVTHCRGSKAYEEAMMREYAAYRLYNALTPESFGARLAHIRYVDSRDGKEVAARYAFFIEDIDHVADRHGLDEISVPSTQVHDLDPTDSVRLSLFQYMISNLDWAVRRGSAGDECCHNMKMIGDEDARRRNFTPVPYDFDQSGLVDAPYAVAPVDLGVSSVHKRVYRGYCSENRLVPVEVARFRAARPEMERVIASLPLLGEGDKNDLREYLASFFEEVRDERAIARMLEDCR